MGANLFTSLMSLGARVLPYKMKGISKVAPALATGAASARGDIGIKKLFGKGILIPPRFYPIMPTLVRDLTRSQVNNITKAYKTGGKMIIHPTRRQIEGGFLCTLASIGIPMAISLVSKMSGSGPSTHGEGYPYHSPRFFGTWENPIGMGVKKKVQRKRSTTRKKQPIQLNSHIRNHFVKGEPTVPPMTPSLGYANQQFAMKPLSNFDLTDWVDKLKIKHFRGVFSRDGLPRAIEKKMWNNQSR